MVINKGTGAGGGNTNLFGRKFDWNKTSLIKNHYFLFKKINNNDFVSQKAFVSFF